MKTCILVILLSGLLTGLYAQSPAWLWATGAQGSSLSASSITVDNNGNQIVIGKFSDTAWFGTIQLSTIQEYDVFVAKIDTNGIWQWAVKCGGINIDYGYDVAIDNNGFIYITGAMGDDAAFGTINLTNGGNNGSDCFVAKLDTNGAWIWAVNSGGTGSEESHSIVVNDSGIYITGYYDLDTSIGSIALSNSGFEDIFVAKLDINGNWLWAVKAGGTLADEGYSIAIDNNDNVFVTGDIYDTAIFGTITVTGNGQGIFVAKLDSNGNWLWAVRTGNGVGSSNVVDSIGNVYIAGIYANQSDNLLYVAGLNSNGDIIWERQVGNFGRVLGRSITCDNDNKLYITGRFESTTSFGSISITSAGSNDIFTAKIDSNGNWLWVKSAGGIGYEEGASMAVDNNRFLYLTGIYTSPASFGSITLASEARGRLFVAKLGNVVPNEDPTSSTSNPKFLSSYPNPFNQSTVISFNLKAANQTFVDIYNIKGQLVRTLVNEMKATGSQQVVWNSEDNQGKQVNSGIYLCTINSGQYHSSKKLILTK